MKRGMWAAVILLLAAQGARAQDDLHESAFVMDAHVHMMSRSLLEGIDIGERAPDGHVDLPRLAEGGVDAIFFSVYTPEAYYPARLEVKNTFRVVELALEQISVLRDGLVEGV